MQQIRTVTRELLERHEHDEHERGARKERDGDREPEIDADEDLVPRRVRSAHIREARMIARRDDEEDRRDAPQGATQAQLYFESVPFSVGFRSGIVAVGTFVHGKA